MHLIVIIIKVMEKDVNPWDMTDIDLAAASIEICNKTGIDSTNPLSDKEKAIMLKGIKELAEEWVLSENDIEALKIYLLEKRYEQNQN